jgi:hypothetical protein
MVGQPVDAIAAARRSATQNNSNRLHENAGKRQETADLPCNGRGSVPKGRPRNDKSSKSFGLRDVESRETTCSAQSSASSAILGVLCVQALAVFNAEDAEELSGRGGKPNGKNKNKLGVDGTLSWRRCLARCA